jgi:phosphate-selective porin OprO/OprP
VGKFKQPFNLEDYGTSSNNIDFIERSYVNTLNPGKKLGMMLHGVPSDGTAYAFSLFQQDDSVTSASGHFQAAGRFATDLGKAARWTDKFLHVGVAGTYGSYDTTATNTAAILDIRTEHRGMNAFTPTFQAGTVLRGEITKQMRGAELAYGQGAFKVQAEVAESDFNARNVATQVDVVRGKYRMHYVAFVYNITGEQWYDSYKDGAFGSLKIKSNFNPSGSGIGAWQVGLRFSSYDATDLQNTGLGGTSVLTNGSNKGKTTTIGLTWFINPNSRVMLNHSMTHFDQPITNAYLGLAGAGNAGDRESVTTLRAQYNF